MKNNFQSKAVPRGTRTIWRYLSALFLLFTFAIGNVWAELTAHTPGVYEKATDKGGYGLTMVSYDPDGAGDSPARDYEVYYFSWKSSKLYLAAGKSYVTDNTAYCLISNSGTSTTDGIDFGWGNVKCGNLSGSNTSPAAEWAVPNAASSTHYISLTNSTSLTLKVSGYDQFSFAGRDNHASTAGKQFVVTIDGEAQTFSHSATDQTVYRFDITTEEHTIVVTGNGTDANRLRCFSLRVPSCEKPDAPTALSCTAQTVNTLTFGWTKEANAVGYVAKLYSDAGCETEVDSKDLGDVNTVTFTGLSNSTTYYCKVQSKGNGTDYCEEGNVTDAANGTTDAPSCGLVTAPTSLLVGATTADGASFTIIDDADAFNYELYVSESSTEPESSATATHTSTEKTKDVTGLTSGTTYYAWVRSVCDADHKSTWTAANKSFKVRTNPTASFADANYIIGASAINVADNFTSNSGAAVVYELKESYPNVTLSGSSFSATAAGEYVVVANQAGNSDYMPISKEATITVLDSELSDIYIWQKNADHGGDGKCVTSVQANQNVNANQASTTLDYSTLTMDGMSAMGRPASPSTVTLTFSVRDAYKSSFGITNVCAYGKIEEAGGLEYSWNNVDWTAVAGGESGNNKHEFTAPAGTFAENFYIRFTNAESGKGGLWFRNALVTLEVKKTVSGVTEALVGAEINGEAISAANLATLQEDKTLDIATAYAAAPTITFKKQVTTSYEGGWAPDVTNVDVEVTASDNTTAWQASATIGGQAYTINLAKPAGPSLETEATAFTLTSAKIATDTKSFTFSGMNLTSGNVTIALESSVAGMTVTPAEVTPTAGVITDQEVTITYKSLEDVAEANVNLVVFYNEDTKIIIPLTYSSTVGYEDLTSISAATTWNWDGAADAAFGTLDQNAMIVLANADVTWDAGFNAFAIAGKLQHYYRDSKYAQGNELKFNTTIPGKVYVTYSNTGGNPARTVNVNGTKGSLTTAGTGEKRTESFAVTAGDVLIKGVLVSDDSNQMLRFYEVRFAEVFAVTYSAGTGSVKGGETLPTQADEAAGEKIVLAAATALEKTGDDFAGWLCSVDGVTYQPGDEYTMTAEATTFTAQWVEHVDPVDPTLTYDNGAYTIGLAALDLSTLITAKTSTGAITYSVKTDGGTGAAIDGNNFTATAAGTATITASQAAVLGYNAITVDFDVVVTEATEIDGIKMVVAEALTGNFVSARTLSNGDNTIEGIAYTKYLTMSSTMTSFGNEVAPSATKGIYYYPSHKNIRFYFYVNNNQSSAKKIYIYTVDEDAESTSDATSANVSVDPGRHLVYADVELTKHAAVVFGVENTGTQICQIVAVESGDELLQGGEAGYIIDYNKCYISPKAGTVAVYDGIEYKLLADAKLVSATNVQLQTLGTQYIKFHLDAPMTVNVFADNKKYYIGSECSTDAAAMTYEATGDGEFSLAAGDWYINGSGVQVKINKLSFSAPKCEQPTVVDMENIGLCEGDAFTALTVSASVSDGGTLHYQWYKEAGATDEAVGTDAASYTPEADGQYYVVVTNQLADHSDNSKTSNTVTIEHFASAVITSAPMNQRAEAGNAVTLTVAATGKNVAYEWFRCDNEAGDNPEAIVPAETNASLNITVKAGMNQWYKVVVSSDCGSDVFATARVSEFQPTTPATVTESIVWDWTSSVWPASGEIAFTNTAAEAPYELLADANAAVPNNEGFRSDMLYGKGQWVWRSGNKFFQGSAIKFTSTVAGMVRVYFRSTGGGNTVNVAINGTAAGSRTNSFGWSEYVEVPAGEVEILCTGDGYTRIQKIEFLEEINRRADTPEDIWVKPGELGTVCLKDDAKVLGAKVFEVMGCNASGYMVFDEILSGEIEAGRPYLFEVTRNGSVAFFKTVGAAHSDDEIEVMGMIGTFDGETLHPGTGNYCYFSGRHIWRVNDFSVDILVPAYCCYVDYDEFKNNPIPAAAPAPGRRRVIMGVNGKDEAQGLEDLDASETPMKVMIDGTLYILRGEKVFDATGRLVK